MLTLEDIDKQIRKLPEYHEARPFLCEGSPIDCKIFFIGLNPSTPISFWPYWSLEYGCNKKEWLSQTNLHYSYSLPPTRKRIERLFDILSAYRCLETNIYYMRSSELKSLPKEKRDPQFCYYLIENIAPKLIFVHGDEAIKRLGKEAKTSFIKGQFMSVKLFGNNTTIYSRHHLSYQCSYKEINELGQKFRD
ncbi:MAG: hypothetical protein PHU44_15940 [Syntrophales bacterium]|nr:hypothetical protein [Syntrophales bacterium]MDD5643374.1 hypothetical protein [Syntrophales bacterium]